MAGAETSLEEIVKTFREWLEAEVAAGAAYAVDYDPTRHYPSYGDLVLLREQAEGARKRLVAFLLANGSALAAAAERGSRADELAEMLERVTKAADPDGRWENARALLKRHQRQARMELAGKKPNRVSATAIAGNEEHSPGADELLEEVQ